MRAPRATVQPSHRVRAAHYRPTVRARHTTVRPCARSAPPFVFFVCFVVNPSAVCPPFRPRPSALAYVVNPSAVCFTSPGMILAARGAVFRISTNAQPSLRMRGSLNGILRHLQQCAAISTKFLRISTHAQPSLRMRGSLNGILRHLQPCAAISTKFCASPRMRSHLHPCAAPCMEFSAISTNARLSPKSFARLYGMRARLQSCAGACAACAVVWRKIAFVSPARTGVHANGAPLPRRSARSRGPRRPPTSRFARPAKRSPHRARRMCLPRRGRAACAPVREAPSCTRPPSLAARPRAPRRRADGFCGGGAVWISEAGCPLAGTPSVAEKARAQLAAPPSFIGRLTHGSFSRSFP